VATKRDRSGSNLETAIQRVRAARKAAGLTQSELGEKLGMSRGGYSLLETGARIITLEDLFRLSRILGRPVEYLLGLDTGLSEDEGQLLAVYRSLGDPERRGLALRIVQSMVPPSE